MMHNSAYAEGKEAAAACILWLLGGLRLEHLRDPASGIGTAPAVSFLGVRHVIDV